MVVMGAIVRHPAHWRKVARGSTRRAQILDGQDIHRHPQLLAAAAVEHAIDRGHIGIVAPERHGDMVALDDQIIGRVKTNPAQIIATPDGDPCVHGVASDQPGRPGGGMVRKYPLT